MSTIIELLKLHNFNFYKFARSFLELITLRFFYSSKIGAREYIDYQLYDEFKFKWKDKIKFTGWRNDKKVDSVNQRTWHACANNKLITHTLLKGIGLYTPKIHAIYHSKINQYCDVPCFSDKSTLKSFIKNEIEYPFISKPINGTYGRGVILVKSINQSKNVLNTSITNEIALDDYIDNLYCPHDQGHLFQKVLKPCPILAKLIGERLSGARVMIVNTDNGPTIQRCTWKIPTGNNAIDNFENGKNNNLVACIDPINGNIINIISGLLPENRNITNHPDTKMKLLGINLPNWQETIELALKAAAILPGLRYQGWDVCFTDHGPVLMEVNLYQSGGTDLSQLVCNKGILDATLTNVIKKHSS